MSGALERAERPCVESPVGFRSRDRRLSGILHAPREGRGPGVVFLNAGLQNRAGPQRIYVKTARRLAERGIAALRIDLPGVGDSEGDVPALHFDVFRPEDVREVVGFAADALGFEPIVLLGMCGGARVAIKAAADDPRVAAVVAWSVPIVSGPPNMPAPPGATMSGVAARDQLLHWAPRLLRPRAWRDYLALGQTPLDAVRSFARVLSGLAAAAGRGRSGESLNFLACLDRYLASGRRALFVYGERDTTPLSEFRERLAGIAAGRDPCHGFCVVPEGDHTFTSMACSADAIEKTVAWLEPQLPARPGASDRGSPARPGASDRGSPAH